MKPAPLKVRVRLVPLRAEREDAFARGVETLLRLGRDPEPTPAAAAPAPAAEVTP